MGDGRRVRSFQSVKSIRSEDFNFRREFLKRSGEAERGDQIFKIGRLLIFMAILNFKKSQRLTLVAET